MIGKTIAHYEIIEKIGAGGMGEVYRAKDAKLGRDVALKLLPESFARDAERTARFQREAQLLASLNHPNIGAIYGLEEAGATRALVLELLEGDTLAERLASGKPPFDEALAIAHGVARAVEAAHEQGVVHRDLKPGNIKLTPDGAVKVLDFGLAKAFEANPADSGSVDLSHSPTLTDVMTGAHIILGTAAYMSPEQARGKPVDKRADIWSFGVILFEMLIGRQLFAGETVSDTLAAVLRADLPWEELPGETPRALRRLLERCLERDPRERLRDIGEARIRLERWTRAPSTLLEADPALATPAKERRGMAWLPWGIALVAAAVAAWSLMRPAGKAPARAPRLAMSVQLAAGADIPDAGGVHVQISPDETRIAHLTRGGIYIRGLDEREEHLLSSTSGATIFTFSPDGQWIAFVASGKLRRVNVTGGAPIAICEMGDMRGMAWVNDSTVVVAPDYSSGLSSLSLRDGRMTELTSLDQDAGERSHRWPYRLPDGQSVLFVCQYRNQQYDEGEIRMVSLADGSLTPLHRGGSSPRYAASGHLLFARDLSVFAVPMDPQTRTAGNLPVPVLSGVLARVDDQETDDGSAQFDVSPGGILVYRTSSHSTRSRLARLDIKSGVIEQIGEIGNHLNPTLSPDGRSLVVNRVTKNDYSLYLVDTATHVESRLTFEEASDRFGCWSPDSRVIYWTRQDPPGRWAVLRRPVDGSRPAETVFTASESYFPTDISPDGEWLLGTVWNPPDDLDVVLNRLSDPQSQSEVFVGGSGLQIWGAFSPDGKWIAYFSNATGEYVLYVRRFPDTGSEWRVPAGPQPREMTWASDLSAIYARNDDSIVRVPVRADEQGFTVGEAEVLREDLTLRQQGGWSASIAPDGSHAFVLVPQNVDGESGSTIMLETGWFQTLKSAAPLTEASSR